MPKMRDFNVDAAAMIQLEVTDMSFTSPLKMDVVNLFGGLRTYCWVKFI